MRESEDGAPAEAAAILHLFFQIYAFLGTFWSQFLLKLAFLNG